MVHGVVNIVRFKSEAMDGRVILTKDKFKMSRKVAKHAVATVMTLVHFVLCGFMGGSLMLKTRLKRYPLSVDSCQGIPYLVLIYI